MSNSRCTIIGADEETLDFISDVLSYYVDGSEFAGNPFWDGRKRLMSKRDNSFPAGLLPRLEYQLKKTGTPYTLHDVRTRPRTDSKRFKVLMKVDKRDYQEEFIPIAVKAERGVALVGTGGGKSIMSGLLVAEIGVDTLVVTPDTGLREQLYATYLALFGEEIVGKGLGSGKPIVIANIQSLADVTSKEVKRFKCLLIDEFHHAAALTYQRLNKHCDEAYFRYGFTGTFTRSSGDTMELHGVLSKVIFRKTTSELIEEGWLVRPQITIHRYKLPKGRLNYKMSYNATIEDPLLNRAIGNVANVTVSENKQCLVLVRRKEHGRLLQSMIHGSVFLSGDDPLEYRERMKKAFLEKTLHCLIATNIFGEGTDIPSIDSLVNARFEKTEIQTKQGVGRALRLFPGKTVAEVHDFLLMGNKHMQNHSIERLNTYRSEPAFKIRVKHLET